MAGPTTIEQLTAEQFAQRLAALMPNNWASAAARQPGGLAFALLETAGTQLSFEEGGAAYALGSTRIQTAQAPELDLASEDFFGDAMPRNPGETDAHFAARLIANLPPQGATRPAIVAALTALTGVAPRVIEWWNPGDTGVWDGNSYWDVDSQQCPARWTDPTAYQGFIITPAPPLAVLNGNPLLTWDDGAYWDVPGYGFFESPASPVEQVYSLIVRLHVEGTIVWVQIGPTTSIVPGSDSFTDDGGVLVLPLGNVYPSSDGGLSAGAVWNNGLTVAVVPGITPNPAAPPVFFGSITPAQLFALGGGNLPTSAPATGSLQLWNNGGLVCVA